MHAEDSFQALHVVSDLHLGGGTGFQIFDQGETLAGLIEHLTACPPEEQVALVLNGDVVDFLAEQEARYLDPRGALRKFERILEDPAFVRVWKALGQFTRTPGRFLVIAMGNHDVELALPPVRERLVQALCGESLEARGRLRLVLDGTGYAARVGHASVLCVHGNEVDTWNWIDHETLRQVIRAMRVGSRLPEWRPNAGTQLVVDVMNEVKKRHPLVDLLKPEAAAVPAVLLALEPALLRRTGQLFPVVTRYARDSMRRQQGLLSEGPGSTPLPPLSNEAWLSEEQLLTQSRLALDSGLSALNLVEPPEEQARLGVGAIAGDLLLEREPRESLRKSLRDWLATDLTFQQGSEDETFRQLDANVGEDIDFLIAGHTHLERALRRYRGHGYYFNTGTWARLIQLTPGMLNDARQFERVYAAFSEGSMAALDQYPELVVRRPTVVSITQEANGTVRGSLGHAVRTDKGHGIKPLQSFVVKR